MVESTYMMIAFLAMFSLTALAALSLVRNFLRAIRAGQGARDEDYVPFEDYYPPAPVTGAASIRAVAVAAVVWGGLHLAVVAAWAATGRFVPRGAAAYLVAAYAAVAGAMTVVGGGMLLARQAYGRSVVAWGQILLALLGLLGIVLTVLLPGAAKAPHVARRLAGPLRVGLTVHLVLAVALAMLARRAGRPADWVDPALHTEDGTWIGDEDDDWPATMV